MDMTRYARQMVLKQIGRENQEKLLEKSVLIVGLGGTGSAAAEMFSRLGVKKLVLIDRDKIEITNLNRQILYSMNDLKKYKAEAAAGKIREVNPDIDVEFYNRAFDADMAYLVGAVDLVFDGTDNMTTRFIINDACDKYGIPWIFTSAIETYGEFKAVIPGKTSCYACFNKDPAELPSCEVSGVMSTIPAIVAMYGVNMAVKVLLNYEIDGSLYFIDGFAFEINRIGIEKNIGCRCCHDKNYMYLGREYSGIGKSILL
ncbi:MAG: HesA/MoeB/ThiF family protein [Ferroplasma sp.]|uniref:HesA/MoeB/ThiF family protein n=1 Tax=Ferroplasma sp. TaxID=2591003 RepID=UPI002816008E|nr:HesA/MoeB/ThiF family protein [Ferroplasma sp.]WMT51610.1 MAG: HesA/MoeB/ThiF family protein [Ferroplasma sp.]